MSITARSRSVLTGALRVAANAVSAVIERQPTLLSTAQRRIGRPHLHDLGRVGNLTPDVTRFLDDVCGAGWLERRAALRAEYAFVDAAVSTRAAKMRTHGEEVAVEDGTAFALYCIVRLTAPAVMIETGVADGRSTATVLAAMEANGRGALHSIEISGDVGALVDDRARWTLHVVEPRSPLTPVVARIAEQSGPADVFMHDGDHSRIGQQIDADAALAVLRPGGLYLSDDAEWSYVFVDTCRRLGSRASMLIDGRKIFGAVRLHV